MIESLEKLPSWLRRWLIFPLIFLNFWLLSQLISYLEPLVSILLTASLFAFLLNFPILFLQKRGIPRKIAIALVFLLVLFILGLLGVTLIPLIVRQLSELATNLPALIDTGSEQLLALQQWVNSQNLSINLSDVATEAAERVSNALQALTSQLLNVLLGTIGSIVNIVSVLVLTIFLVITGESVWQGILSWLPQPWNVRLRFSIRETFQTYFATQAILAGILSVAQTVVFSILNVPYALLFGVAIGMSNLIPYASSIAIAIVSLLLILQNFELGIQVLIAAIVLGQINDSIVAPRLMGGVTGLNPVWIVLSLFVGSKLGGILGLLVAVPIASIIKNTVDDLRSPSVTESLSPSSPASPN